MKVSREGALSAEIFGALRAREHGAQIPRCAGQGWTRPRTRTRSLLQRAWPVSLRSEPDERRETTGEVRAYPAPRFPLSSCGEGVEHVRIPDSAKG